MAKISNLVTFAILLGLITLFFYLFYLRKRRTQQTLLWLRTAAAHDLHAQNQFSQTVIYPYGNPVVSGHNYYCNTGPFIAMGFESAQLRGQNFEGAPWHTNAVPPGFHQDMSHLNSSSPPHYIATPPYMPGNFMPSSTIEDLPPPYSSIVGNESMKTEPNVNPEQNKTEANEANANANINVMNK